MATRLINVRLAAADVSKVDTLKAQGVNVSEIVRQAIRAEYSRRSNGHRDKRDVKTLLEEVYARYPVPDDTPRASVDTRDRKASREWITQRVRGRKTNATTKSRRTT